jgi:type I restriction enzyme M protein
MKYKNLIKKLGFNPKENTFGIFHKTYPNCANYEIEIDFSKEKFNFGNKINADTKTTQNFTQAENWVVLECVNRLLEKGYQPQNIILEKTWATGHGTSGRLDILVTRNDGSAYLMIECKTWGIEYEKELKNLGKNGGQLFTYFQQDKDADILMLYSSGFHGEELQFRNEIIKIEDDYRQTGNVKDLFERWNKLPKSNGIFDNWANAYEFQSKALTPKDLKVLQQKDSSFIFNRFLEILRHNVVSDKPNAFNKIFTLFLCKIVDENRNLDEQLHFQWLEGEDNHISFQKRLTDLYNRGMLELLEKKVTDVSDNEFDKQFLQVEEQYKEKFKEILTEIRLKKNNEFAIKEVYDDISFEENAKVVKEVVELLQVYQLRYNYRQQFLSDFFELLLTTGLKQESGQFFTPVPIARFIIKSLPFQELASQKIATGNKNDLLPNVIDYAAGSGHFITESMEEIQKYIDNLDDKSFNPSTKRAIKKWKDDQFDWAEDYVYGIEKDYRLVKTAKVSCYLHGDGLAKVIHGDGLADFATATEYKDLLKETDKTYSQDNKQFDVIVSNPPYSVSAFKGLMDEEKAKNGFDLYNRLTDQSSEIECLFIERTKQLLKDGGVAGIILPSSILNNSGIYTQAREILLKYFEFIAITEMGSNTFMATGTNTVTLFLRRRNNADAFNIEEAIKRVIVNHQDITINGIENPISKYVSHVWENISFNDYKTLLQKSPNQEIEQHEIYTEYKKKIKSKNNQEFWSNVLSLEQDKLLYFILSYPQKVVLLKTGSKTEEKQFLGYEFSNRRGSEGIHPIQRSKSIDECTQLYDPESFINPEKASTYILKAFNNESDLEISENLQKNLSYHNLVDMLTFDRVLFEKSISLSIKKKVKIESKWEFIRFGDVANVYKGVTYSKKDQSNSITDKAILTADNITLEGKFDIKKIVYISNDFSISDEKKLKKNDIFICFSSGSKDHLGKVALIPENTQYYAGGFMGIIRVTGNNEPKYFFQLLNSLYRQAIRDIGSGANINNLSSIINEIKIPIPPIEVQQKIVLDTQRLDDFESKSLIKITEYKEEIKRLYQSSKKLYSNVVLSKEIQIIGGGTPKTNIPEYWNGHIPWLSINDFKGNRKYVSNTEKSITNLGLEKSSTKLLAKGDLIISARGTVGELAILSIPMAFNQSCYGLRTKENLLNEYLYYCLKYEIMQIKENSYGAIFETITTKTFDSIKIPLPSLQEQSDIVNEINKFEQKILELEKEISLIPKQKEIVLRKYLQ